MIDETNTKILVCCHKPCELPKDDIFLPVHVGAAISSYDLRMQRDDECLGEPCDNISEKNGSYCELTALYWAWKNLKKIHPQISFIGINHYRRYFDFKKHLTPKDRIAASPEAVNKYKINKKVLTDVLEKGLLISAKPRTMSMNVFSQYSLWHRSDDLRKLIRAIHVVDSSFDDATFYSLIRENRLMPYNMMVCSWTDFELYAEWLFRVLEETEKTVRVDADQGYQSRIYGFMAERLWNVWIAKQRYGTKTFPIIDYSGNTDERYLQSLLNCTRKNIGYRISRPSYQNDLRLYREIMLDL